MAWLKSEDLNDWVEIINYDGEFLGWLPNRDCSHLNIPLNIIETPNFYREHPAIVHHSKMAYESGVLKARDDSGLSEIQTILLASIILNRYQEDEDLRQREFEENLFVNNQEVYSVYKEQKELQAAAGMNDIEERTPQNFEEFLSILGAFEAEAEEADENLGSGWLDSVLSDEELDLMGE